MSKGAAIQDVGVILNAHSANVILLVLAKAIVIAIPTVRNALAMIQTPAKRTAIATRIVGDAIAMTLRAVILTALAIWIVWVVTAIALRVVRETAIVTPIAWGALPFAPQESLMRVPTSLNTGTGKNVVWRM